MFDIAVSMYTSGFQVWESTTKPSIMITGMTETDHTRAIPLLKC